MLIGVTIGDVAGVGPEIILQAYAQKKLLFSFVVIGDLCALQQCADLLHLPTAFNVIDTPESSIPGKFNVIDRAQLSPGEYTVGKLSAVTGKAAYDYLVYAINAALNKQIDAIVTLPMNKEATRQSVPSFSGHTDVIAEVCNTDYTMTLISDKLVVPHVSSHVSLLEAINLVKTPRIVRVIQLTHEVLLRLQRSGPIAVLGLNPHAGEAGAFGIEEIEQIIPAIEQAKKQGIDVIGPLPPDTAFMRALRGEFPAVVCMYHDQGHIPMKTIGFEDGVNVTVGLPIVRTSVDHGTAFDIAGKGIASISSFVHAFELGAKLAFSQQ